MKQSITVIFFNDNLSDSLGDWPGQNLNDVQEQWIRYCVDKTIALLKNNYSEYEIDVRSINNLSSRPFSISINTDDYDLENEIANLIDYSNLWDNFCYEQSSKA